MITEKPLIAMKLSFAEEICKEHAENAHQYYSSLRTAVVPFLVSGYSNCMVFSSLQEDNTARVIIGKMIFFMVINLMVFFRMHENTKNANGLH